MNILAIGKPQNNILEAVLNSKLLDKFFTAGFESLEDIPNIEYVDFDDLIYKAKALQIDLAITTDAELLKAGIADSFKSAHFNFIGVNKKWFNLESQRLAAKQLLTYYSINTPAILKAPLAFPVILKSNKTTQIATSMQDLIQKREELSEPTVFLEEYLCGETYESTFLWDEKNLFSFPLPNLTEVQEDRLELLKTKLVFMLSDEKADFTGFFTTKLLWANNDWYILDFIMRLTEKSALKSIKTDFLYLLNSAIYQKLYEIR